MDAKLKARVLANLFPSSWAAVDPWDDFPWHLDDRTKECDSCKRHSSQALAIDVFGTLKAVAASQRDVILDQIAARLDVPAGGPWQIALEWSDPKNRMNENAKRRTQVDAVAFGAASVIFFECKFTESPTSACSQTSPIKKGKAQGLKQCNGNYELQTNPLNDLHHHCALSGKRIRYWEFIPGLFGIDAATDHSPCPFAGPAFQWMRNLTISHLIGNSEGLTPRVAVVHARHPHLPMNEYLGSTSWQHFVDTLLPANRPRVVTMQDVIRWCSEACGGTEPWPALAAWVDQKVVDAAARVNTR